MLGNWRVRTVAQRRSLLLCLGTMLAIVLYSSTWAGATEVERSQSPPDEQPARFSGVTSVESHFSSEPGQSPSDATGHLWWDNYCYTPIKDNDCGTWTSCGMQTPAALPGAVITQVDTQYRIDHTAVGDLRV
jgi:hypothetical protein